MDKIFGFAKELVDKGLAKLSDAYGEDNLYDTLIQFQDDIPFYLHLADKCGGKILDLGCGSGRVIQHLLREGFDAVGVDRSTQMLAQAQRKLASQGLKTRLYQGDMRTFSLDERFALVIIPYCSMIYMTSDEDRLKVLNNVARHLEPGGLLAFDFDAGKNQLGLSRPWVGLQGVHPLTGDVLLHIVQMNGITEELRVINQTNYNLGKDGWKIGVSFSVEGSIPASRMRRLLEKCGYAVDEIWKDHYRNEYDGGEECLFVARKL